MCCHPIIIYIQFNILGMMIRFNFSEQPKKINLMSKSQTVQLKTKAQNDATSHLNHQPFTLKEDWRRNVSRTAVRKFFFPLLLVLVTVMAKIMMALMSPKKRSQLSKTQTSYTWIAYCIDLNSQNFDFLLLFYTSDIGERKIEFKTWRA